MGYGTPVLIQSGEIGNIHPGPENHGIWINDGKF